MLSREIEIIDRALMNEAARIIRDGTSLDTADAIEVEHLRRKICVERRQNSDIEQCAANLVAAWTEWLATNPDAIEVAKRFSHIGANLRDAMRG